MGFVKCLKQELHRQSVRYVYVNDGKPPHAPYQIPPEIIDHDLVVNVVINGVWGSYHHIPILEELPTCQTDHAYLTVAKKGDLSSFTW